MLFEDIDEVLSLAFEVIGAAADNCSSTYRQRRMRELEVNSRLRTAGDVDMESLAVHVMPECRCLVVVHPSDRRPFDWVGRNAIMKLNEETRDMLLVLVEPDREQAVTTASWDVLGDVVAGRE